MNLLLMEPSMPEIAWQSHSTQKVCNILVCKADVEIQTTRPILLNIVTAEIDSMYIELWI